MNSHRSFTFREDHPAGPFMAALARESVIMELTGWISALSSVASLSVAALATGIAWRGHKREAAHKAEAKLVVERGQADLVTAWETARRVPKEEVDTVPGGALTEEQKLDYGDYVYATNLELTLVNQSSQPVYDLRLNPEGSTHVLCFDILPPGEKTLIVPRYTVVDYSSEGDSNRNEWLLTISFRDVSGNWWLRDTSGALIKVTPETKMDTSTKDPIYSATLTAVKQWHEATSRQIASA